MFLIVGLVLVMFGLLLGIGYTREKYIWNQGYCRNCGGEWVQVNKELDGMSRTYRCECPDRTATINYKSVDLE